MWATLCVKYLFNKALGGLNIAVMIQPALHVWMLQTIILSASRLNAHPHTSCDNSLAVVHNGIIENHFV